MPLIDSDTWKSAFRSLNQLRFHPANPRLPELGPNASESQIIHELCKREDVESIARNIASKGYFRNDRLIVLVENKKHIVYEGNRRLCALKILADPSKAPKSMRVTITKLAEKALLPKKIAIEIVPSKHHAEVVMFSKHALDKFMKEWKPLQKAAFVAGKVDEGLTLDDISDGIGLRREEVVLAKAAMDLYRFARLAPVSPAARELINDPQEFPYSIVFERLFQPPKVQKALGVEITSKGLTVYSSREHFLGLLAKIMNDVARGYLDTRKLNTVADALNYVAELDFTADGGTTSVDEAEKEVRAPNEQPEAQHGAAASKKAAKAPAKASKTLDFLFMRTLENEHDKLKLTRLLDEGQRTKVVNAPHACAFLLRSTLEIALTVWLKQHRHYGKVNATAANKKHGPSLAEMLDYINLNPTCMSLDPQEKGALEALISRSVKQSKAQLDRIVHHSDVTTHAEEIISIREQALPILRKALLK